MKKRVIYIFSLVILVSLAISGCSNLSTTDDTNETPKDTTSDSQVVENISFTGINDESVSIPVEEIKQMKITEIDANAIKSSGDIITKSIKGINLDEILKNYNLTTKDFSNIEVVAYDGYSSVVPSNIIEKKDIYLIFEEDKKPLESDEGPFKLAIPDERAMYWVKGVSEINFENTSKQTDNDAISIIHIIENTDLSVDAINIDNESINAYNLNQLKLENDISTVLISASDGLEKEVNIDVFNNAYLTADEKEFTSEDMQKGMTIKEVMYIKALDTLYVSLDSYLEASGDTQSIELEEFLSKQHIDNDIEVTSNNKSVIEIAFGDFSEYKIINKEGYYKLVNEDSNEEYEFDSIIIK